MNRALYRFLCFVMHAFYAITYRPVVDGVENIPAEGGFIVCCNHVAARDPFFLVIPIKNRFLHFMGKAELFRFKPLGAILRALGGFPVDRGHSDLSAMRTALALLKDGHGLGIFPQGTRSRDNTRTPMLDGVGMIALRAGVPVIPAFIGGPYRLFRRTQVSFGKPVDFSSLPRRFDSDTLRAVTQRIEDSVWALKK